MELTPSERRSLVLPIIRNLLDEGIIDGCDVAVAGKLVAEENGRVRLTEVRSSYYRVEEDGDRIELCIYNRGGPDLEIESVFRRYANTGNICGIAILIEHLPNAEILEK